MSPDLTYYTNHANAVGVGPEDGSWLIAPDGRIVDVQPPWRLADDELPDRLTPVQSEKLRAVAQWHTERTKASPPASKSSKSSNTRGPQERHSSGAIKIRSVSATELNEFLAEFASKPTTPGPAFTGEWWEGKN